jgi:hypothetical protein
LLPLGQPDFGRIFQRSADSVQENPYFTVTVSGLSMVMTPKPGKGESLEQLRHPDSAFRRELGATKKEKFFISFFVHPDSLEVFRAARDVARKEYGFSTGWNPLGPNNPASFGPGGRRGGID